MVMVIRIIIVIITFKFANCNYYFEVFIMFNFKIIDFLTFDLNYQYLFIYHQLV